MEYLAVFYNHTQAMRLAQYLRRIGVNTAVMPLPRVLSANCGTAVRFWAAGDPLALCPEGMYAALYLITPEGYRPVTE